MEREFVEEPSPQRIEELAEWFSSLSYEQLELLKDLYDVNIKTIQTMYGTEYVN